MVYAHVPTNVSQLQHYIIIIFSVQKSKETKNSYNRNRLRLDREIVDKRKFRRQLLSPIKNKSETCVRAPNVGIEMEMEIRVPK